MMMYNTGERYSDKGLDATKELKEFKCFDAVTGVRIATLKAHEAHFKGNVITFVRYYLKDGETIRDTFKVTNAILGAVE